MCVALGLAPGIVLPTLTGLAPGGQGAAIGRHAGLFLPGTGSYPAPVIAIAIAALTGVLVAARGTRRAAPSPAWACGQPAAAELRWTSAAFTKPLRLVLDVVLRPRREVTVAQAGGLVQSVEYKGEVPSLLGTAMYEPTVRGGLRAAAVARRMQSGNVRTYAAYLLALVIGLLVLIYTGVLG
jgi:hydrogenase-4 component B